MRALAAIAGFSVLGLTLSPALHAQSRGHVATVRVAAARPAARPIQMRPPISTATSVTTGHPRVIVLSPNSGFSFDDILGNFPVPGLGFDYAHLAAINSGAGVRALIDPVTQHELALALAIRRQAPVGFTAFPGFFPGFIPATDQAAAQPTIVVVQQPAAPDAQSSDRGRAQEPEPRSATPVVEPARDAGDFVLVRRDGGLLFAVAYRQGVDRITYITKEGVRRGLALADLDVDATVSMNEERGTPLQFPESLRR
jgi:hypothetical protein